MRKKTKFKSLALDFIVILFCLSAASFFIWLFWKDLNYFTVRSDKPEIGYVSLKQNVVQRRFNDRVVWERISNGAKLYYGDTLRTADMAEVTLELGENVIKLGENTMIQVGESNNGGFQIAISGGDIQIDSGLNGSAIEVKLDDGSVVNVGAGSSLSAKSDSETGIHNVEVKSGSAQLTTETGESAMLSHGESVNVEQGGEIQKNNIVVIYPPKDLKLLSFDDNDLSVKFDWRSDGSEDVFLETSKTKDFAVLESKKNLNSSSAEIKASKGNLYWRVYISSEKENSVNGRITVAGIENIRSVSPANQSEFKYRTSFPRVAFRWIGNEYAERYNLLVSSTPDMRSVVLDSEVNGNFLSVDTLEEGTYFWQITPYYGLNNTGYKGASEVSSFVIRKNQQIKPPELSVPAENAQIVYRDSINTNFIWKSDIKDCSYELSLARDPDFSTVVFSTDVSDARFSREFTSSELRDGTYYWKVRRISGEAEDIHPESEIRTFKIVHYIPEDNKLLYPPEDFSGEPSKISATSFMWKLADEYNNVNTVSVVQISQNSSFTPIQIERSTSKPFMSNISLPSGTYWWRVGVRTDNGESRAFTQPRMFTVLSDLARPEYIYPGPNQELTAYNGSPVTISWEKVNGADYYSLKIFNKSDELVKNISDIHDTSFEVSLPEGIYESRIQAFSSNEGLTRAGEINSRRFSITSPLVVVNQSPSDGAFIPGLTAIREPLVFSWEGRKESSSNYTFVLSKLQKDGSMKIVASEKVSKTSLSKIRLTEGSYSWKIEASTKEGIPLDSRQTSFTIGKVDDLEKVNPVSPALDFVIGPEYLKSHRTIEFNWKEVNGATNYSFVLYRVASNGDRKAVYSERNLRANYLVIKDLSILDVGNFEWSVTAYSYAKDGYLEQKSGASLSRFKIDFALPSKVEGKPLGTMYGN